MSGYPPLDLLIRTPMLELRGATDELLESLVPAVRSGIVDPSLPPPFDDPASHYEDSPLREWRWLRTTWAGRSRVDPTSWRLYFVVVVDGEAMGMQDLIGIGFVPLGTVATYSWLVPGARRRGIGTEMRQAILHLAFEGLGALEATSEAFVDNAGSNGVSRALGYEPNGTTWATRRGDPAELRRWTLSRRRWEATRRDDIELAGVEACRPVLGL